MDFSLDAKTRDLCRRIDAFLEAHVMALEQDPSTFGEGENIREDLLQSLRLKARAEGLWCFQMPVAPPWRRPMRQLGGQFSDR